MSVILQTPENTIPSSQMIYSFGELQPKSDYQQKNSAATFQYLVCTLARFNTIFQTSVIFSEKLMSTTKAIFFAESQKRIREAFILGFTYTNISNLSSITTKSSDIDPVNTGLLYADNTIKFHEEYLQRLSHRSNYLLGITPIEIRQFTQNKIAEMSYIGYEFDENKDWWDKSSSFLYLCSTKDLHALPLDQNKLLPETINQLKIGKRLHLRIESNEEIFNRPLFETDPLIVSTSLDRLLQRVASISYFVQLYKNRINYLQNNEELQSSMYVNELQ